MRVVHSKIKLGLLLLFLCVSTIGKSQLNGALSQYMFNTLVLSPGYTGAKEAMMVNMNLRQQWTGFSGAPKSQIVSMHTPLRNKDLAAGVMIVRESIGVSSDVKLSGSFAYRTKLSKGKLSIGVSGGIGISSANWTSVSTTEDVDIVFSNNETSAIRPVFGTGIFYKQKQQWYAGYSIPSLIAYDYDPFGDNLEMNFDLNRMEHLLIGGYVFKVNRKTHVKPSFLLRYMPTTGLQADINTNVIFDNKYWVGLSIRTNDAVVALLEYNINYKLKMGYSYDFNFSEISTYSSGSHEIGIEYGLGMQIKGRSPRHF